MAARTRARSAGRRSGVPGTPHAPADRAESTASEKRLARQARMVAIVIAVTIVGWVCAQWLGGALGWPARFAFLFDFAALAAFLWALIVTYGIWRKGRKE